MKLLVLRRLLEVRNAHRQNLPLLEQLPERPGRLGQRRLPVGRVQVIEVDHVRPQPLETLLALPLDRLRPGIADLLLVRPVFDAALGRDDDLVPAMPERPADQPLAFARVAVDVGRIEEVDPRIERRLQRGEARFLGDVEAADARNRPAPHGNGSDEDVGAAECGAGEKERP